MAAAPLANDRAKAERFGFAFVSCWWGRDYNVPMVWWLEGKEEQRERRRKVEEKFN
jgi:hypothetical protein